MMFKWFKKKEKIENPIEIVVSGINPQTDNEYLFYNFVETTFAAHIHKWYEKAKENGIQFKPHYEKAIKEKISTSEFKNPHSFPEYFNNEFDFIAIDFETANQNRVSACALGLVFVKNNIIVHQIHHHIRPPKEERFASRNIAIHGITAEDVEYALTFDELWEFELSEYLNKNLIVFHNSSMDLSVFKTLFKYYSISEFNIEYIDTMQLAAKTGNPRKLVELAEKFDIEYLDRHNPEIDAKVCAQVYVELREVYPRYEKLIKNLSYKEVERETIGKREAIEIKNQNLNYLQLYSLTKEEILKIEIENKGFVFTGEIDIPRNEAKKLIENKGGIIKTGITSKVDYVVVGSDFGWSKIQKVHEYNENKNCKIKILTNSDFQDLVKK